MLLVSNRVENLQVKLTLIPVTANATSTACHATIRDRRQNFDILTITLLVVTSIVVALRFFERIQPSFSLHADDYIILFCLVR